MHPPLASTSHLPIPPIPHHRRPPPSQLTAYYHIPHTTHTYHTHAPIMAMASTIQPGDIIEEESLLESLSKSNATQYISWIKSLDAILVLGGGVPLSVKEPPEYVQRRCDVVAELFGVVKREGDSDVVPNIICLSAGTAHLPQYILPSDGLREFSQLILARNCITFTCAIQKEYSHLNPFANYYSIMGGNIICSISNESSKISC